MKTDTNGCLLRIYIGENDQYRGRPLYQVIVNDARERQLAGATVLRGSMGYGAASRVHTAHILRLSEDLPLVIEIVDTQDRIEAFLPHLEQLVDDGLITLEPVRIIKYCPRSDPAEDAGP